jgi:hypothetical protein
MCQNYCHVIVNLKSYILFSDYHQYTHVGTRSIQTIIEECIKKVYGSETINGPNVERNKREFESLLDKSSSEFSPNEKRIFYQVAMSMMMNKMIHEMQVFNTRFNLITENKISHLM